MQRKKRMATQFMCVILLILGLKLTNGQDGFGPTIDEFPSNDNTLVTGQDFTMKCRSSIESDTETIWFRGTEQIDFSKEKLLSVDRRGDMTFINPQPGENDPSGSYTCSLKNQFGITKLGYMLKVSLAYFEDEFRYTPRDNFFYAIPGSDTAWANCLPPHSHPQIVGTYLNGSSGLPANLEDPRVMIRHLIRNGVYTQIIIQNATKADAGRWACIAKHRTLGEKKIYFDISFYGPPPKPKNQRVKQSRANGFIMEWDYVRNDLTHYDFAITKQSDRTTQNFQMKESLSPRLKQFLTYEFKDLVQSTQYSIIMRGTDQKGQVGEWSEPFLTTTVDEMAPLLIQNPPEVIRVGENKPIVIECIIEALPTADFEWFRDGRKMVASDEIEMNGNKLTLKKPKRGLAGSEGKYKCKAKNKLGEAESKEGKLIVEWIDKEFQIAPRTRFFYATDKFLRVSARLPNGIEPINVQWRQSRKLIVKKTHPLFSPTLYRGPTGKLFQALDIRTPTIVQSDVYHVSAWNLGGAVHKEFRLILAPPPLPIGIFNVTDQRHGSVSVRWKRPRTIVRLQKLGYAERTDIYKYQLMYRKATDTGNGTVVDVDFDQFTYTMKGLDIAVDYIARVRAIDYGEQIGKWSLDLKFKLEKDLPPAILKGPEELTQVKIGESTTLTCDVSADKTVQIRWYRDEIVISRSQAAGYQYLQNGGLKLDNIQKNMAGMYHCQASTQFGTTNSKKGEIKIVFLERDYVYTRKIVGVHDKSGFRDARILCIPPKSFPTATVLWANNTGQAFLKRGHSGIELDENYIKDGVRYYSLVIKNAVQFVGQTYGCVVYNRVIGTKTFYNANTKIKIFGKPDPPSVTYRLASNDALVLEWTSTREDITRFQVTVKDGSKVVQSITTQEKSRVFKGLSNTILYTFQVVAVDVASQSSQPGSITMSESKPTIRKDLPVKDPTVVQGEDVTFECDFYGYPFPIVKWFKNGKELSSDANYKLSTGNRKLTLVKANHNEHNGKYQCEAVNKAGTEKSREMNIEVTYIDRDFKYKGGNVAFVDRDGKRGVMFACAPPDAYPPFDLNGDHVHWLFENKPLTNSKVEKSRKRVESVESDVIEFEADSEDVGTYTCAYPHPAGAKRHDMLLTVADGARKPVNVAVKTRSYNFFVISWQHAGDEINGYRLKVSHHSSLLRDERVPKTTTEYTFDKMSPETVYEVSVVSLGVNTNSVPVKLFANTTKRPIIGVPSIITKVEKVNVGSTSATVRWESPDELSNNHPDRLTYEIKICENGDINCNIISQRVTKRQYTFTGLHPVTVYKFYITVFSETVTPGPQYDGTLQTLGGGAPPAILNFEGNPSWNTITVSWKAPHATELYRVQYYILRISSATDVKKEREERVSKDRASYFFLDLLEGQTYKVAILAHYNGANGPVNEQTVKTLDLGVPGEPSNVLVKMTEDSLDPSVISITFEWSPPKELARNPIDEIKYQIKICDFQNNCDKSDPTALRSHTFYKKKAGITYSYEVTTLRADEKPGHSARGDFNSENDLISAVDNPYTGISDLPDTTVLLSWGMPQNLQGYRLNEIKFTVEYCRKGGNGLKYGCIKTKSLGTSIELTGLYPATEYLVTIRAQSPAGISGVATTLTAKTEPSKNPGSRTTEAPPFQETTRTQKTQETTKSGGFTFTNTGGQGTTIVKEGLSTGAIIGIVLAVIIISILVSAGVIMYMKKRKQGGMSSSAHNKMTNNGYIVEVEMNRRKREQYARGEY